jgi:hypothetical protein
MRQPDDSHYCPLFNRTIYWGGPGGCYEVQDVRSDDMDLDFFPEAIDLDRAEEICEKCRWYNVAEFESHPC